MGVLVLNPLFLRHSSLGLISNLVCGFCAHLSQEGKVKRRGLTTLLWINLILGICGELWLIFGFCRLGLDLLP
jgi:hypothetical protein